MSFGREGDVEAGAIAGQTHQEDAGPFEGVSLVDATSASAPHAWRRHLYLMLDAYRADRAHPIPEPPMTDEQLYDAMVHLSQAE